MVMERKLTKPTVGFSTFNDIFFWPIRLFFRPDFCFRLTLVLKRPVLSSLRLDSIPPGSLRDARKLQTSNNENHKKLIFNYLRISLFVAERWQIVFYLREQGIQD